MNHDTTHAEVTTEKQLNCMRCGYSLLGLETSAHCPECGRAISTTLAGPHLRHADPFFVHRLLYGTTGVLLGWALFLLVTGAYLIIDLTEVPPRTYQYWLTHLLLIGWSVVWFSALILLAPRGAPAPVDFESPVSPRKLLLYCSIFLLALHILPIGLLFRSRQDRVYDAAYTILDYIAMLILLLYLSQIARRTGNSFLVRHFPFALGAMAVAYAFNFVLWYVWRGFDGRTLTALYVIELGAKGYVCFLLFVLRKTLIELSSQARAPV